MNNKTDKKEDIKIVENYLSDQDRKFVSQYRLRFLQATENILADRERLKAKANKYDALVEKIKKRIESVEKIYEGLLTDIGGIKIINVSGLSKKEKEEVINKRNCLIIQKATFEEVLQELLEKEEV